MTERKKISEKEYQELIKEIKHCEMAITERFDVYVSNAISRLVEARIKLNALIKEAEEESDKLLQEFKSLIVEEEKP